MATYPSRFMSRSVKRALGSRVGAFKQKTVTRRLKGAMRKRRRTIGRKIKAVNRPSWKFNTRALSRLYRRGTARSLRRGMTGREMTKHVVESRPWWQSKAG